MPNSCGQRRDRNLAFGIKWTAANIGTFPSWGSIGMMQRPIASGLGSDYPRRRSGRKLHAERMGEHTHGVMNNRQRDLRTSGKRSRTTSMTTASCRLIVTKRASVLMDSTIWLVTSGSGRRIGMIRVSTGRALSTIQQGLQMGRTVWSAVGPGSMLRSTRAPQGGRGSHPRHGTAIPGSVAPRTFRTNLYALTLFPFLRVLKSPC